MTGAIKSKDPAKRRPRNPNINRHNGISNRRHDHSRQLKSMKLSKSKAAHGENVWCGAGRSEDFVLTKHFSSHNNEMKWKESSADVGKSIKPLSLYRPSGRRETDLVVAVAFPCLSFSQRDNGGGLMWCCGNGDACSYQRSTQLPDKHRFLSCRSKGSENLIISKKQNISMSISGWNPKACTSPRATPKSKTRT